MDKISSVWMQDGNQIVCTRGCPPDTRFSEEDMWKHNSFHNNIGRVLRNVPDWTPEDKARAIDLILLAAGRSA